MKVEVPCPAKINTFLSVGPVDGAGYHPIRTVFQAISLCDTLLIEKADADEFLCNDAQVPNENTVTKAWRLAKEYVNLPTMCVSLTKKIPAMSGLGGGSSDAAGFLRGLMRITKGRISPVDAHEISCAVGADVPFFLVGGRARAEGYGEKLTPLPDIERQQLLIIKPNSGVSSGRAYAELDKHPRSLGEFPAEPGLGINDFEAVAPPESANVLTKLRDSGIQNCGLSGSGSAVFAIVNHSEDADFDFPNCQVFRCHTLTRKESLWTS